MKCNKNYIVAYFDDELDEHSKYALEEHVAQCPACSKELADLKNINTALAIYEYHEADAAFFSDLYKIQFQAKKNFSIFHLFPRELAFTAMFVFLALYIGMFFSSQMIGLDTGDPFYTYEYFEEISLVSLLEGY